MRIIIVVALFLSFNLFTQTKTYLKDSNSPASIEDIVKLLNLKNAKRIAIFSKEKNIILGEILLYKNGKCFKKNSYLGNNTSHTYDINGNLTQRIFFINDSTHFLHYEKTYNKRGDLIETIYKDKYGKVINKNKDSLILSITLPYQIPRYKSKSNNYIYNSAGYLIKYFSKGFYLPSSKSAEEEEFNGNEKEYNYEYNNENQIIRYYKRIKRKSSNCEVITEFNYIDYNIIEVKSNENGCRLSYYNNLVYKIEYY